MLRGWLEREGQRGTGNKKKGYVLAQVATARHQTGLKCFQDTCAP